MQETARTKERLRIAHIVNPFCAAEGSEHDFAQKLTWLTIEAAIGHAEDTVEVELYSAQYPEDHAAVPDICTKTRDLDRSVLDVNPAAGKRKLPLAIDILNRLREASDADWNIYTNVDICLQKNFYLQVASLIDQGYDAFTITRRDVSERYRYMTDWDLDVLYNDAGKVHPGYDCFVLPRNILRRLDLGWSCIGVPGFDFALMGNVIALGTRPGIIRDSYATFHVGSDGMWAANKDGASRHSLKESAQALGRARRHVKGHHRKELFDEYYLRVLDSADMPIEFWRRASVRFVSKRIRRLLDGLRFSREVH